MMPNLRLKRQADCAYDAFKALRYGGMSCLYYYRTFVGI